MPAKILRIRISTKKLRIRILLLIYSTTFDFIYSLAIFVKLFTKLLLLQLFQVKKIRLKIAGSNQLQVRSPGIIQGW